MGEAALRVTEPVPEQIEVLFVDDDAGQREMYRRRLERVGYAVRLADSADAAAQEVRARRPQVVVLDIAMPGRDGLSALHELLAIEPTLPVIINTAHSGFTDNFLAWAADAYIAKTAEIGPLLRAIEGAIVR